MNIKITNNPLVYIIVLNYCSYQDTIECVNKLKKVNYNNYKIIVIDNNSPDGSGENLYKNLKDVQFIMLKKNTGYAGGNNLGIGIALKNHADYVFIVNPDIRLQSDSLNEYIRVMEEYKDIGALNPIQINLKGDIDQRFKKFVLKNIDLTDIQKDIEKNSTYQVETLFGASILFSRKAIETVGGFDPLYFAYGEEEDLCRRLKYFRFKLCVTSQSPVLHLRSYENRPHDKFREYLRLKGRFLYKLKNPNQAFAQNIKDFYSQMMQERSNIHFLKMIFWCLTNLFRIYNHWKIEKKGFSHLSV